MKHAEVCNECLDRRDLADLFLEVLHEGIVPWRWPINMEREFKPIFGQFFAGEPLAESDYSELDAIIQATGAKIIHNGRSRKPRFHRETDTVVLPVRSYFCDERTYNATRIHEVLHFLENPRRLGWIGSDHQSELVCEIGTGLLESHLRLPPDQDNTNIKKWLPTWNPNIRLNPDYLFDAVESAKRSVNHLLELRRRKAAA